MMDNSESHDGKLIYLYLATRKLIPGTDLIDIKNATLMFKIDASTQTDDFISPLQLQSGDAPEIPTACEIEEVGDKQQESEVEEEAKICSVEPAAMQAPSADLNEAGEASPVDKLPNVECSDVHTSDSFGKKATNAAPEKEDWNDQLALLGHQFSQPKVFDFSTNLPSLQLLSSMAFLKAFGPHVYNFAEQSSSSDDFSEQSSSTEIAEPKTKRRSVFSWLRRRRAANQGDTAPGAQRRKKNSFFRKIFCCCP